MLPLLMMLPEPCFRIWGAACFMPSITLRTSVAIAASKRSTSRPSMPPVCAGPPALLNRQSMRPNFSTASAISARICVFHRDVGLAKDAVGAELFGQRLALRRAAPGDDDFRAFGDEYFRGAQSDAARRAGDHRNLAVQPSHVVPPVDIGWRQYSRRRRQGKRACSIAIAGADPACRHRLAAKSPIFAMLGLILDSLIT